MAGNDLLINWELKEYPRDFGEDRARATVDRLVGLIDRFGVADRSILNSYSDRLLEYAADRWPGKFALHGYPHYRSPKDVPEKPLLSFLDWAVIWDRAEDHPAGLARDYAEAKAAGLRCCILVHDVEEEYRAALALDACEQGLERLGAHGAGGVRVDLVDDEALGLERLRAVQDGVVLDRRDDDVRALCPGDGLCQPADRRVVRLGAARGKGQLGRRMGAERGRDALARVLELVCRRTPLRVERVGVCPRGGCHRVGKARVERGRCRIVQIRAPTHGHLGSAQWPRPGLPP